MPVHGDIIITYRMCSCGGNENNNNIRTSVVRAFALKYDGRLRPAVRAAVAAAELTRVYYYNIRLPGDRLLAGQRD